MKSGRLNRHRVGNSRNLDDELAISLPGFDHGMTVSAISRETGIDRKTVRKYIERGLEAPAYGPRTPPVTGDGVRHSCVQ